jgi:hypothetical protein
MARVGPSLVIMPIRIVLVYGVKLAFGRGTKIIVIAQLIVIGEVPQIGLLQIRCLLLKLKHFVIFFGI